MREQQAASSVENGWSDLDDSVLNRVAECDPDTEDCVVPEIGSVLDGKYELEAPLGRGGMACVFAARHLLTGRRVAIKWMLKRDNAGQLSKRFVREARAAGRIRHPNVIEIHDAISHADATYLVLELLHGESLRARLNSGTLQPARAIQIALAVLEGLREAHRQGVIHRDLKPENIFLCRAPSCTKLLDFGISVLREPRRLVESHLTRTGCFIGTPVYTALERLRENQPFDHRVDLYSVGVVLYEGLTGALPFSGRTPSELTYQLAVSTPRSLRALRPELSESLEAIVLKALEREPSLRFADADSFIEALRSAMVAVEEQGGTHEETSGHAAEASSTRADPIVHDRSTAPEAIAGDDEPIGRVKGTLLVHLYNYAIRHHGPRAWQEVLAQLSSEDRSELSSLLIVGGWYPVGLWNRTLRAYLKMNFTNPGLGMTDFGHYVAAQDLSTLFKLVLRMGSADMVVARTASLYNRYFDSGTWTPYKLGQRHWRCILQAPSGQNSGPGALSCSEGITAWVQSALAITGTKATVEKTCCRFQGASACEYEITWHEASGTRLNSTRSITDTSRS